MPLVHLVAGTTASGDRIAPMPGRIVVVIQAGDAAGQEVLVMEAMKMELSLSNKAPAGSTACRLRLATSSTRTRCSCDSRRAEDTRPAGGSRASAHPAVPTVQMRCLTVENGTALAATRFRA